MSSAKGNSARRSEPLSESLPAPPSTLDPSVENAEYVAPGEELDDNFFLDFTAPTQSAAAQRPNNDGSMDTRHHTASHTTRGQRKQVQFVEDVLGRHASPVASASSSGSGSRENDDDDDDDADGHHAQQSQVLHRHEDDEDEDEDDEEGSKPFDAPARAHEEGSDAEDKGDGDLEAKAFAAFPQPTPPASFPFFKRHVPGSVTRVQYHSLRFGDFIKAYVGLSDKETEQAKRRGRSICMIGVTKSTRMRNMTVRTGRPFLRHSVLAVEGDAVFAELIDRAEQLYAVEQERVRQSLLDTWRARYEEMSGVKLEADPDSPASPGRPSEATTYTGGPPFLSHTQSRRVVKVTEPLLRPNARCIALHYGFSEPDGADREAQPPPRHLRYPRATLIAVICTTRLAENTEIYVSLESYYRCLDEAAWYQRCYGTRVRQQPPPRNPHGAADGTQASAAPLDADNPLDGDIYTGVKHFHRWPKDLSYFHGIGKQHASPSAEASFPFTLVDLTDTPELGAKELGVRAAEFIPYATCFLYTGPSVATQKVEKLIAEYTSHHNHDPGAEGVRDNTSPKKTADHGGGRLGKGSEQSRARATAEAATTSAADAEGQQTNATAGTPEDFSFVSDDTYALSLGKHGVCFGQGLARYINHRYNMSRFGNVELCSVMLSVPSEFSPVTLARKVKAATGKRRPATRTRREAPSATASAEKAGSALAPTKSKKASRPAVKSSATSSTSSSGTAAKRRGSGDAPAKSRRAAAVAAISAIQDFESDLNAVYSSTSSSSSGSDMSSDSEDATSSSTRASAVAAAAAAMRKANPFAFSATDMDDAAAAALLSAHRKKRKKNRHRPRATRMVFLEEQSHFVSVPFFITTADVDVGDQLLAWTYGEAYDAKLERQVVAHGSLVPYADAELLNRRFTVLQAQQQAYARAALKRGRTLAPAHCHLLWQRYNGDYRYALGVGDVVWRRRPVETVVTYRTLTKQGPIPCLPLRSREMRCPSPEDDLFVIVQQMRSSVEKVLLKPLRRRWLASEPLKQLLLEQDLAAYRSPAAPVSWRDRTALAEAAAEAVTLQPRLLLGAKVRQSRSLSQGRSVPSHSQPHPPPPALPTAVGASGAVRGGGEEVSNVIACAERLSEAWGVFDVSLQYGLEELRQCVVASTDSLALLLADVDYYIVQESATLRALCDGHAAGSPSLSSSSATAAAAASSSSPSAAAAAVAKAQHLIVNLDDLRDATELVRSSDRAMKVPALFNGLMWPVFHRQVSNFGFECLYAADKKGPSMVKLEE